MQQKLLYLLMVVLFGFSACRQSLSPSEYISWTENSDELITSREMDNVVFEFRMKPADYIICKESKGRPLNVDSVNARLSELTDMVYFNLKIYPKDGHADLLRKDAPDVALYQKRIYYYSFTFQNDISLISEKDTLPCLLFHYIHDHGLSPEMDFTMAFERPKEGADFQIVIDDAVMNTGKLTFPFDASVLTDLPELDLTFD